MYTLLLVALLLVALMSFGMLRGLAFYGTGSAAGAAATIFDPVIGAAVAKIPQAGDSRKVVIRGTTFYSDIAGDHEEYAQIIIGQGGAGDAHKITIRPAGDGNNPNDPNYDSFTPLGDFEVMENEDLSILLVDPGAAAVMCGCLWYEDGEPEMPIPKGRVCTFRGPTSANYATTFSATGGGNFANLPDPDADYYVCGMEVLPQGDMVQVIGVVGSGKGNFALGPPKGRIWYPSCPLKFSGLETVQLKGQVAGATEVGVTVFAVEVPKVAGTIPQTDVRTLTPFVGVLAQRVNAPTVKVSLGKAYSAVKNG